MTDTIHKFTEAGLGSAPFKYLGCGEEVYRAHPDAPVQPGASCDYCGTGIRHVFYIRSADGRRSKIGSECINKAGDRGLISRAKAALNARRRAAAQAKRQAAWDAEHQAQRDRNGGLTDYEVKEAAWAAERAAKAAAKAPIIELLTPIAEDLEDGRGGFCDSVARDLRRGDLPSPNGCAIVAEILGKAAGRRNSAAYKAEEARVSAVLAEAEGGAA
jgi:hypothetical protein